MEIKSNINKQIDVVISLNVVSLVMIKHLVFVYDCNFVNVSAASDSSCVVI